MIEHLVSLDEWQAFLRHIEDGHFDFFAPQGFDAATALVEGDFDARLIDDYIDVALERLDEWACPIEEEKDNPAIALVRRGRVGLMATALGAMVQSYMSAVAASAEDNPS